MEIIKATTENKRDIYLMTHSISTGKVSALEGQVVTPEAWAYYTDTDRKTGELKEVLTLKLDDGEVYGTISKVFIESFMEMTEALGELTTFEVKTGTSKAGRSFIYPVPA